MDNKMMIYKFGSTIAAIAVVFSAANLARILFGYANKTAGGSIALSGCAVAIWYFMYSSYIALKRKQDNNSK
jgi:hypothetical protein